MTEHVITSQVILTSFHRSRRMQGQKYSICRFQPAGFELPELRFFAAEDTNGRKLQIRDAGGPEKFAELYREALASRWKEVKGWLDSIRNAQGSMLVLCCWCPFSEETKTSVKTVGTFLCHSGLVGKLINKHCPEVWLMLDEDRAQRLDTRWRPERYEVVNSRGEVETQQKVLFTSGTLYLEDDSGIVTAEYFLRNIGLGRAPGVRCLAPVKTPWLHDCVTLHYGKQGSPVCFEPPVSDREEYRESTELYTADRHKWHQNLAVAIQTIAERAIGGTLVLGTAYDDIAAVKGLIGNKLGKRLLVASRGQSMRLQKAEFMQLAKKGKRPIWITLGGAWTGLDLSDPAITPADDTILTDLVIAKLPFNLNQSLSYLVRTTSLTRGGRKYSSKVREKEAAFWFKQGVGRLVRRPVVQDRHLWVLDGRLWSRKSR